MINTIKLGQDAAALYKQAVRSRQGRAGRNVKGTAMQSTLHAAGQPKMNTKGVFAFPRGQQV